MNTAVFASEKLDVAGVPNYIKEIVLGTEVGPVSKAAVAPIKTFAREVWLRTDKTAQANKGCEGLSAKEIVDVWHYVCNDDEEWRGREDDPITLLRSGIEFFGGSMPRPVQLTADGATINLDIVSGRKLEKFLAKVREERFCKIWKQKLN